MTSFAKVAAAVPASPPTLTRAHHDCSTGHCHPDTDLIARSQWVGPFLMTSSVGDWSKSMEMPLIDPATATMALNDIHFPRFDAPLTAALSTHHAENTRECGVMTMANLESGNNRG